MSVPAQTVERHRSTARTRPLNARVADAGCSTPATYMPPPAPLDACIADAGRSTPAVLARCRSAVVLVFLPVAQFRIAAMLALWPRSPTPPSCSRRHRPRSLAALAHWPSSLRCCAHSSRSTPDPRVCRWKSVVSPQRSLPRVFVLWFA